MSDLSTALREMQPSAGQAFKDRYVLEFLGLPEPHNMVEYALSRNLSPALVAQYQLQLPDKKLIAAKMHELLTMDKGVGDE